MAEIVAVDINTNYIVKKMTAKHRQQYYYNSHGNCSYTYVVFIYMVANRSGRITNLQYISCDVTVTK
jgi:hypothetical protein